ncbi:hypothetical protein CEXT_113381 [Caerostris extrusa]|uniref:Uncharacterized protein n=1 Tax=Caerostris extrusa TaxID=172846 RepID=A0AAV4MAR9_CAEEX|nr:hypothetical protein CEXT_113381 [Caerostris extrusa]
MDLRFGVWNAVSPRLCYLRLIGKFNNYSIIHVHAPTEDEEDFTKNLTICGNDVQDVMVTLMPKWAKKRNFVL